MNHKDVKNIDEYIATFPITTQLKLEEIRAAIKKVAPEARECFSYKMPAFEYYGMLVYFAAYKNHIGFYALPKAHKAFQEELNSYKTGKGSVQFPLQQPMPIALIEKLVKFRVKENLSKAKK